jgi:hypothetical protein
MQNVYVKRRCAREERRVIRDGLYSTAGKCTVLRQLKTQIPYLVPLRTLSRAKPADVGRNAAG